MILGVLKITFPSFLVFDLMLLRTVRDGRERQLFLCHCDFLSFTDNIRNFAPKQCVAMCVFTNRHEHYVESYCIFFLFFLSYNKVHAGTYIEYHTVVFSMCSIDPGDLHLLTGMCGWYCSDVFIGIRHWVIFPYLSSCCGCSGNPPVLMFVPLMWRRAGGYNAQK